MTESYKIIIIALIVLMAALSGCAVGSDKALDQGVTVLTQEEKQELLEEELQARQIDEIDRDLTEILMAEDFVRYCYVVEQDDIVAAHIYFYPGTDYDASLKVGDKAWDLLTEKYPEHNINVIRTIEE